MTDAQWHLLSYDVRDDKRRRKAHRLLGTHGDPVQYSVFRVHVTPRQLLRIQWELRRMLDPVDSLLVIPIPDAVAAKISSLSGTTDWTQGTERRYAIIG